MPRGDGTGPMGMGPMTGRAAGFCAGYSAPGYVNPVGGRGFGFGRGRGGGRGRGPGRGMAWRRGWAMPGYYGGATPPYAYGGTPDVPPAYGVGPYAPQPTPQQELDGLKSQAEYFQEALNGIKNRIGELEKSGKNKEK